MQNNDLVFRLACHSGLSVREIFMNIYSDPHRAHDELTAYMADDDLPQRVIDYCLVRLSRLPRATNRSTAECNTQSRDGEAEQPI